MKDLKTIRGMPDLYDEDIERIVLVENTCLEVFKSFNYKEFRTPVIENKSLFQRSAGETSDIVQKEVYDALSSKYKLGRVRILLKEPRSTLSWHRDPEPRLHIPIISNPGCLMVIDNVAKHMPADGSVWVTNNTKYHNAFNGGEENRIHLVACVLDYKFN